MTLPLLESIRRQRLFEQRELGVRLAPFGAALAVALATYPFGDATYGGWLAAALASAALTLAAVAWPGWQGLPGRQGLRELAAVLPLLLFLQTVAFLREAHGGAASGYLPLVLVPVVWAAVFGRRRDLALVLLGVGLVIGLPPLLGDSGGYPPGEFRRAILFVFASALCGGVIEYLIRSLLRAQDDLVRARAHDVHDDLVQAFAAANLALDLDDVETARVAVRGGLTRAQRLAGKMLADASPDGVEPGMLRRATGSSGAPA